MNFPTTHKVVATTLGKTGARWLTTALATAALAGCGRLTPTYERPAAPVPAQFAAMAGSDTELAAPDLAWQDFFQDARLKQLIGLSLEHNRDLRVAALSGSVRSRGTSGVPLLLDAIRTGAPVPASDAIRMSRARFCRCRAASAAFSNSSRRIAAVA